MEAIYNRHRRQARVPVRLRVMQSLSEIQPAAEQVSQKGLVVDTPALRASLSQHEADIEKSSNAV